MVVDVRLGERHLERLETRLLGAPQADNLALALAAAEELLRAEGRSLDEDTTRSSLFEFVLPARLERFGAAPAIYLDGAHTVESLRASLAAVRQIGPSGRLCVVWAMADDKDLTACAAVVATADQVVATRYNHPRAAAPERLAAAVREKGGRVEVADEPENALDRAVVLAERGGLVLVSGSLYLAGALRRIVSPSGGDRWST